MVDASSGPGTSPSFPQPQSALLTFLIADIRGYTRFTLEFGDEAAAELASRFAEFCEDQAGRHNGRVIELRGDEALCVFQSARDALRGAVALQQVFNVAKHDVPALPFNVGIGLDAGDAVPVKGGYRGGALNLAARLCSIAGTGQILASEGVIHLCGKTQGLTFVDRGKVTLKGLTDSVRVYQIAREGELPEELPPLQPILATYPTNLPDDPTHFIGREREIAAIAARLRDPHIRLVTLTGPGGTGKTRLALQVGNTLLYDFHDGVFFCDLSSLVDPALVPSAIARVLGVGEQVRTELIETLLNALREKHLLLVLDNLEHLLDASYVVARLLDGCQDLHILITSRTPLHLRREQEHNVLPLSVPDPAEVTDVARLSQYESVALFLQRATAAKDSFTLTDENGPAVAEICARLDGLPLAIELAAARIKLFPPRALLERLRSCLTLLIGGARDLPQRQQTLRGTIDWSYTLLSEDEQVLFSRLSVLAGGWTFEAAEMICNWDGELKLLDGITSLVDKSLLRQEGENDARFSMLESIREYAHERVVARGEEEKARDAHARYFLSLAERIWQPLIRPWSVEKDVESNNFLWQMAADLPNFREALARALEARQTEQSIRLAGALWPLWQAHGDFAEGRRWLDAALTDRTNASLTEQLPALLGAALLALRQGDLGQGKVWHEEYFSVAQQLGHDRAIALGVSSLAMLAYAQGNHSQAVALGEESVAQWRAIGDLERVGTSLGNLGLEYNAQGDYERAATMYEESRAIAHRLGQELGVAINLHRLGHVALSQGKTEQAAQQLRESLRLSQRFPDPAFIHSMLEGLAGVAGAQGQAERAARLFGAAEAIRRTAGLAWANPADLPRYERAVASANVHIEETTWERAWQEGRAMRRGEAVAYALEEGP